MNAVTFPGLRGACRYLDLDVGEVAEAVLHKLDAGYEDAEAVRMTLTEFLQRRGLYRGALRAAVESGEVFQMREGGDGHGRMGKRRSGTNPPPQAPRRPWATGDVG